MTKQAQQTEPRDTEKPQSVEVKAQQVQPRPKGRFTRWLILFAVVAGGVGAAAWWVQSLRFETTDDAQVDGHLDSVSSRIAGTVTYINPKAENNQYIKAGTLLVELDPRDYQAELDHARADLDTRDAEADSAQVTVPIVDASANSQLLAAEAAKAQATAAVSEAEAALAGAQHRLERDRAVAARAARDRVRYRALVEKHEISRSDYDARDTEATAAAQAVESDIAAIHSSEQKIAEARSLVEERDAQIVAVRTAPQQITEAKAKSRSASGRVEQAAADVHTAQLNLSYTKIFAPVSGVVGRKTVELGHRIQPGQALMIIVPLDDIWITANFKETQMKKMHPGEAVAIHVDSLDRDFRGKVESMPGAAGPLFSLFPPENATGNYVKVVQRFPVRIRLDAGEDPQHALRPGMSVEPKVTLQ
jgi:membrane fusion protein (multidrug efflux system)